MTYLPTDRVLRDKYLTHLGGVRIGRLLEDMDIFAAHVVKNFTWPTLKQEQSFKIINTLYLGRIRFHDPFAPKRRQYLPLVLTALATRTAICSMICFSFPQTPITMHFIYKTSKLCRA
jgi:hypothetical protein